VWWLEAKPSEWLFHFGRNSKRATVLKDVQMLCGAAVQGAGWKGMMGQTWLLHHPVQGMFSHSSAF